MFMMVEYVREMTAKKSSRYGEYGSFEQLLFFFFFLVWFGIIILTEYNYVDVSGKGRATK